MSALPPKADIRQRRIGKLWTAGNQLRFIYLPTWCLRKKPNDTPVIIVT